MCQGSSRETINLAVSLPFVGIFWVGASKEKFKNQMIL